MELSDVKQVTEVSEKQEVNRLLSQGWQIIGTYTRCYDAAVSPNDLFFIYVLGSPANSPVSTKSEVDINVEIDSL